MAGKTISWLATAGLILILSACRAEQVSEQPAGPGQQATQAIEDLSSRLGIAVDEVRLVSEKTVTWRDGSLGCPKQGMMYTQALVPGTLIVLGAGGVEYDYHAAAGAAPFYCEAPRAGAAVNPVE